MNHYPTASAAAIILAAFNLNVSDGPAAKYFAIACSILGALLMVAGFIRAALTSAMTVQTEAETPRTPSNPPERGTANRRRASAPLSPTPSYGVGEISPIPEPSDDKPLAGMSFALTGKMPVKRAKMECLIEHFGGSIHRRTRKDTDFLVVGESRTVSSKEASAGRKNIATLSVDELAKMCGITYHDIRDRYFQIVPAELVSGRLAEEITRQEARQYAKAAQAQRNALQQVMSTRPSIVLSCPVVVISGQGEDTEVATVNRLEFHERVGDYVALSTDGEAIYISDLRDCSVADLLGSIAA